MHIKTSAVSYLNTKPLLYGLEASGLIHDLDLSLEIPSLTAAKLLSGEADLGLVPVAILPLLPAHAQIVGNYCIGAKGAVKTVCLYSQVPLQNIEQILLDHHSRTSVQLVQVLCRDYWQIHPDFIAAQAGFETQIDTTTAGVIIGDRAIDWHSRFAFCYDLGAEWTAYTNLPFVFAAWVATQPLEADFIARLDAAFQLGVRNIDKVAEIYKPDYPADFDIFRYLTENISYELDAPKRDGLSLFLQKLKSLTPTPSLM